MDSLACGLFDKVTGMSVRSGNGSFERQHNDFDLSIDDDLLMEQILENMNSTPLGRVLKKIAEMPEVSRKKVLRVRRELSEGSYDLNVRLDSALEKVLDDLDA